jgi:hypothetical protein
MADELEPIGPEVQRQLDEVEEAAESTILPGVRELPWVVPRSQLEALEEEEMDAVIIDQNEKNRSVIWRLNARSKRLSGYFDNSQPSVRARPTGLNFGVYNADGEAVAAVDVSGKLVPAV